MTYTDLRRLTIELGPDGRNELRVLLERHDKELAGAFSPEKRSQFMAQHDYELRQWQVRRLLKEVTPEEEDDLPVEPVWPSTASPIRTWMNIRTSLEVAEGLFHLLVNVHGALELVDGLAKIGVVMKLGLRDDDGKFVPVQEQLASLRARLAPLVEASLPLDGLDLVRGAVVSAVEAARGTVDDPKLDQILTLGTTLVGLLDEALQAPLVEDLPPIDAPVPEATPAPEVATLPDTHL